MILIIILSILTWLACGALANRISRTVFEKTYKSWTQKEKEDEAFTDMLGGVITLAAVLFEVAVKKLSK